MLAHEQRVVDLTTAAVADRPQRLPPLPEDLGGVDDDTLIREIQARNEAIARITDRLDDAMAMCRDDDPREDPWFIRARDSRNHIRKDLRRLVTENHGRRRGRRRALAAYHAFTRELLARIPETTVREAAGVAAETAGVDISYITEIRGDPEVVPGLYVVVADADEAGS